MASQPSNVSGFKRKASAKLALNREVHRLRIGCLQVVINRKGLCKAVQRRGVRVGSHRRRSRAYINPRKISNARETRCCFRRVHIGGIGEAGAQAEGAILIEGVYYPLSEVVIVDSKTRADSSLAVGA